MPLDILRDSTFGNIVNYLSKGRYLPYEDQKPGYTVPQRYLLPSSPTFRQNSLPPSRTISQSPTFVGSVGSPPATLVNEHGICKELAGKEMDENKGMSKSGEQEPGKEMSEKGHSHNEVDAERNDEDPTSYPFVVAFEENDQDRPQNWSPRKRYFVGVLIGALTFSIYVASAIYTSSIPGIMQEYGVGDVAAIAGLSLFVAGYGISPMVLSPMQEVPSFGRNPVYIVGLALFLIFQIPPIFAPNIGTILVFRFLAGAAGGPALATGGASMGDIVPGHHYAIALSGWSMGAVLGPIFGPVIGGFAAQANGWRWSFYELLWIGGVAFIVLFLFLPETLEDTVLLRRAQRLRKLTGNDKIKAPSELGKNAHEGVGFVIKENIYRAIRLSAEPSILVANSYIALVYSIFYLWFEAFPIVFTEQHGFNLGLSGLPYLGFVVSGIFTLVVYVWYQLYRLNPYLDAHPETGPEIRLKIAIVAAVCIPISLFGFGWTAQTHQHWILPIIFAAIYLPGIFLAFQSIMMYVALSYPKYAASVLAGNDLFRSVFASVFPLFGAKFFRALGLGGGSSLLAGVSILMIPTLWAIMKYGATLRARSSFAN